MKKEGEQGAAANGERHRDNDVIICQSKRASARGSAICDKSRKATELQAEQGREGKYKYKVNTHWKRVSKRNERQHRNGRES